METRGGPSVAAALGSGEAGPGRAGRAVFGLTLRFALSAPPFGLRRASLRARPKTAKRKKNEQKRKKGDTSNEIRKGTFLMSVDIPEKSSLSINTSRG